MKKLLLLCSLVYAINASAIEMPSQEQLNALLQEHVDLLAQTPIEDQSDVRSEWTILYEKCVQEMKEMIDEKGVNSQEAEQLMTMIFKMFALPLNQAIINHEGFDAEQKAACQEAIEIMRLMGITAN